MFKKASRKAARLRLGLIGPAGSGKTYSALKIAYHFGGRIALIDTEHGSASKYALPDGGTPERDGFAFDVLEPDTFSPQTYTEAIRAAGKADYDLLIIDSLSHAWIGKGGALELVDRASAKSRGNSFAAWRHVTPLHNELVDTILSSPCHVIATLRSKMEYVQERDERTGKTGIRKIGMQPIQRDGIEYEFDVVGDLDQEHVLTITKSRCPVLSEQVIPKPGSGLALMLKDWLEGDAKAAEGEVTNGRVGLAREVSLIYGPPDTELRTVPIPTR